MDLRPASEEDAPAITRIWNRMITDTAATFTTEEKSADAIAQSIRSAAGERRGWLVACAHSGIDGFATYGQFRKGPGYANTVEHSIVLAEAATGRGVGRALIAALAADAAARGNRVMIGGISGANPRALAFHLANGFAHVGTLPRAGQKHGHLYDLHLVQRML